MAEEELNRSEAPGSSEGMTSDAASAARAATCRTTEQHADAHSAVPTSASSEVSDLTSDSSDGGSDEGGAHLDENSDEDSDENSDEDSDENLNDLNKYFTNQSAMSYNDVLADDEERLQDKERRYVAKLAGAEGTSEGTSMGRFEGWLGKDVLLQGKIFLTRRYFLFYAHLPPATLETLKASPLAKKSSRRFQAIGKSSYHRYWFVLRMGSFAWYDDPSDVYFPVGILPLNQMASISQVKDAPEKFIIKGLDGKSYTFKADSRNAAHEWSKSIQKEMFRARNHNTAPAAVVRIPWDNMFYINVLKPLDIVKLINIQVVLSTQVSEETKRPYIGHYTFAFFGDKSITESIVNRIGSITNDFQHQSGVRYANYGDRMEIDYQNSKFGTVTEDVYDTTPPSEFHLFDGRSYGDDREVLVASDETEPSSPPSSRTSRSRISHPPSRGLSPVSSHNQRSRSSGVSRVGSRLTSLLPSQSATPTDSYSHSRSKLNIVSALNDRLHKLKSEEMFRPEISAIASAASMPVRLVTSGGDLSNEVSDNEEGADSDYDESDSESDNKDSGHTCMPKPNKFLDDKFMPFVPQNFTKKLLFGSASNSNESSDKEDQDKEKEQGEGSIECDSVRGQEDLNQLNSWFREHFGLEPSVYLLAEYICNLRKPGDTTSWTGKLLVSNQFLCFQRRNVTGSNWRMVIPLKDIIHIQEEPMSSTKLEFEVAETAYSVFRFTFSEPAGRRDAESMLKITIKHIGENDPDIKRDRKLAKQHQDADSESRFLEYSLRSARLATYEPSLTSQLQRRIPPLIFDPSSTQYKEIFLQKPMRTLKFAMLMIGSRGDVQPYIALCQGLMAEGHKCCILTHKEFKSWVESFGIEFREISGDPRELMEIMISHGSISYGFVRDALSHFKGWLKELMHTCWKALKHADIDVLIESPSSMIGIHIAEALSIAYFRAFTMPWTKTRAYPQALISSDQKRGGSYNLFTYLMYDRLVWFGISKYVNRWRKHHLDLPETDLDSMRQEDVPFLYCVSPTVLVPPLDQPDWVHTCGYWELREDKSKKPDVDPKLVEFIKKARTKRIPLVYIGFGSIIVSDPEAMTQTVVDATKEAGVYCVLARGWSSRSTKNDGKQEEKEKKPLNVAHIFEVDSVPHQWLFPQMDACVHHGGSGTTGASLRAGKPTIVKPFFGDQFFYGHRVEDLGVGYYLKKLTKSALSEALHDCVTNKQMIRQAGVLGQQIRHEHGVDEAILSIYRELSYAEDVTIRRRKMTLDASKTLFPEGFSLLHPRDSWLHGEKKEKEVAIDVDGDDDDDVESLKHAHSWFSLPKFGRREEQRRDRNSTGEIDVSV